ncbi:ATP-dependent Clp protease ATP-binding subunit [Litchfieldia salsa]|uniref:ATP-dependent Clp protease ATP-binding subunit ClpE n=1 Tax=Litchfieldia salsa TaxID=930152 RepID=A0A1H0RZY2_9BACI|nr:ATP-dependent Clp protease ATP-binding subunit [Litchfieldia salsa]SDP34518.1 ATP-dependent Clp protease ATP-binding subunit ClpE [Litchfieldia salsa]
MKCQLCKLNEATIQLNIQMNEEMKQTLLCHTCYSREKSNFQIPNMSNSSAFSNFDQFLKGFSPNKKDENNVPKSDSEKGGNGFLDQFGRNLTQIARAGLIDPVIGRDEEVARVIEILNRRNKNNPVLIGEPGVGKTAIIEGLALKISSGEAPNKLLNKEVYLLDVASLVANTGVRGQFEERMRKLISELKQRKNVILFIDEIHLIVGAGSAEGSMDAGNILKPALARGELQLVGATTLKEYRQIEKDAALERRFQPVMVQEPSISEALQILQGIKSKYEDYHEVHYTKEALEACVTLSHRYIQDRFLPDKAIDLLDEAGSRKNLTLNKTDVNEIQERLNSISLEKEKAASEENYELAAKLRHEEILLEKKVEKSEVDDQRLPVTLEDIQYIIEKKTGIPVGKLHVNEQEKMKKLEEVLASKVIGQEEAVAKVSKAIRRSRAGLKSKNRPIGSFLFVGPTGVGKTELSKSLAQELFGTKDSMIRLDMSEYMEKHTVSKIIGSPPGYIGHEESGQLTEMVRRNPYSIILLDEVEKAHPDVQHMFLQILDDGRLTDSQGRTISFKDTVLIMTSNAGVGHKKVTVGFEHHGTDAIQESNILESLGSFFKPEFLNRFDSIIEFKHLEETHLLKIVDLLLEELSTTLLEQRVTLTVEADVKQKLVQLGYHPAFGARPLRRVIQEQLEDQIADIILDQEDATTIIIKLNENKIIAEKK